MPAKNQQVDLDFFIGRPYLPSTCSISCFPRIIQSQPRKNLITQNKTLIAGNNWSNKWPSRTWSSPHSVRWRGNCRQRNWIWKRRKKSGNLTYFSSCLICLPMLFVVGNVMLHNYVCISLAILGLKMRGLRTYNLRNTSWTIFHMDNKVVNNCLRFSDCLTVTSVFPFFRRWFYQQWSIHQPPWMFRRSSKNSTSLSWASVQTGSTAQQTQPELLQV